MTLAPALADLIRTLARLRSDDGVLILGPRSSTLVMDSLMHAAEAARQLEAMAGLARQDVVAFAKAGEPRPCAEVIDLSEIMQRERKTRPPCDPSAKGEARFYAHPAMVPFDGGAA